MTPFPLSISKRLNGYHPVSLFFSSGGKTLELAFASHPSLILLNEFHVELVASADLPLICGSHVMQWHATSCSGRERARSGMKGQGRSCEQEASVAGEERFAALTIVIYTLFSVSRIDSYQEDDHSLVGSRRVRLDLYTLCASGSALSHFVHNFIPSGFPRLSRKDDFHCLAPFSFQVTSPSFPSVGA